MVLLTELSTSDDDRRYEYDVFLSFRGLDTRLGFVAHLHNALKFANLSTFYDDEEIDTGLFLKPKLEGAIKASRASIIVLSKNYASSTWCLNELLLILDQHRNANQIVIPIFFHVEPTHVRKQENSFGEAMEKHKQRMEAETDAEKRNQWAEKMKLWKEALVDVANLKGKDAKGRKEPEFIEEIVTEICSRLGLPLRSTLPFLIGMDDSIKDITSWLTDQSLDTVGILTITGMGGIGKTTLATYVYRSYCHKFHTSSFIEDISRNCANKFNGLLDLQNKLYGEISKKSFIKQVHDVASKIENALSHTKVFVVLDDVDSLEQLDALLGKKGLHPGSKIIVTTKDASLTERCALFKMEVKPMHIELLLEGLYGDASLKLFCHHAFMCDAPKEGYKEVTKKLVKYCGGHPLALEVLGKSLYNREVAYWQDCIKRLEKELNSHVSEVLQLSFDSLPFNDKELFKHIACFFVGMERDYVEIILSACDINTKSGIINLIERCLLGISQWNNTLTMHQLLQEMGRDIVRHESPNKPWERTRLWCHEEIVKVLKRKKDMDNLLGLVLDMRMLEKEDSLHGSFELETDALSNMDSLILLQLNYVHLNGSCKNFPQELRWLCMHGLSLKSIPLDLPMKNLVSLDISYSKIQSFDMSSCSNLQPPQKRQKHLLVGSFSKQERLLGSLKILNLSLCEQLRSISGFSELPVLERLIVKNCKSLVEVCESIEQCVELVYVNLSGCINLKKFPRNLGKLKKVETLLLDGCDLISEVIPTGMRDMDGCDLISEVIPTGMRDMDGCETLTSIEDKNIAISSQTCASSAIVKFIPSDLKLFGIFLPSSLVRLSLRYNNLSNESFPRDFSGLFMLKELFLDGNPIVSMPNCVRSLPRLEMLSMSGCRMLTSIEHPPCLLRNLSVHSIYDDEMRILLRRIVFDPEMSQLQLGLDYDRLPKSSFEIEGMVKIEAMAGVEEKVLHSLGWSNLESLKKRRLGTFDLDLKREEGVERGSQIQMYYEFGIFSTIYGGEEMPQWITKRFKFKGPSTSSPISFTVPSSASPKLRGLNLCCCVGRRISSYDDDDRLNVPVIKISNITKKRTWIYKHFIDSRGGVNVGGGCLTYICHWMIGKNEMEAGDHLTITIIDSWYSRLIMEIRECGFSLVYDDEEGKEEEVLGYYKSWNHIIGGDGDGDLSPFLLQTTSSSSTSTLSTQGEETYLLWNGRFFGLSRINIDDFGLGAKCRYHINKDNGWFRALSQRNLLGQPRT